MVKTVLFFVLLLVSSLFSVNYSLFEFHTTTEHNKSSEIKYAYADGLSNSDNSTTFQEGAGNGLTGTAGGGSEVNEIISDSGNTGEVGTGTDSGNTGEAIGEVGKVGTGATGQVADVGIGEVGNDNGNTGEVGGEIGDVGTESGNASEVGGVTDVGSSEADTGQIGEGEVSDVKTNTGHASEIGDVSDVGTGTGGTPLAVEIFDIDTTPPSQVTGLVASTGNLAWTQNSEADFDHYNIYRGTSSGFSVTPGITPPTATSLSNSFQDSELNPSTTYYYKVAAVDNAGNIGPLSIQIAPGGSNHGGGVGGSNQTGGSNGGGGVGGGGVGGSNQTGGSNHHGGGVGGSNQTGGSNHHGGGVGGSNQTGGSNGGGGVGGSNQTGGGNQTSGCGLGDTSPECGGSNLCFTNPHDPSCTPAQVTDVTISIPTSTSGDHLPFTGQFDLNWSPSESLKAYQRGQDSDFDHYNIYRGNTSGFSITPGTTPPTDISVVNGFHDSGLKPFTTYYYRIAEVDHEGNIGPLSAELFMVTAGGTVFCDTHGEIQGGVFAGDTCNFPPDEVFCGGINSDPSCPPPSPQELNDILNGVFSCNPFTGAGCNFKAGTAGGGPFAAAFPGGALSTISDGTAQSVPSDPNALFIRPAEGSLSTESICNDGMDNDHDGLVDMKDPNCIASELSEQGQTILSSNASEISHVNLQGHQKLKLVDINATFSEDQIGFLKNNETTKLSPHHDIRTSLFFAKQTLP